MPKIAGNVAFWEKLTSGGTWIMSGMQQQDIPGQLNTVGMRAIVAVPILI